MLEFDDDGNTHAKNYWKSHTYKFSYHLQFILIRKQASKFAILPSF